MKNNLLEIKNCLVGFDVDYTLTMDNGYYKNYIDNYLEKNKLSYVYMESTKNIRDMYNWDENTYLDFMKKEFFNLINSVPVNESTKKYIDFLEQNHCQIIIITGRKQDKKLLTMEWLKKYGIKYTNIIFGDKSKLMTCKKYNVKYFFDDDQTVVNLLNENGIKGISIDEVNKLVRGMIE